MTCSPSLTAALFSLVLLVPLGQAAAPPVRRPSVVLIFTDDQGYGDVGCYGATGFKTPHLDRLAREGLRFTDFYSGCPVCTGSRAALLTGRHYRRVGVPPVLFPIDRTGLPAREITVAQLLRSQGYATALIGKWHLGHLPEYLPTRRGFDHFLGLPYSNDMALDPPHASFSLDALFREGMSAVRARREKPTKHWVPLMRGEEIIEYPADQSTLTRRYTEEAVRFIRRHRDRPFFLYLAHSMPHLPLSCSTTFQGRTESLYGDVMEEIDWSTGEILKVLADTGLDSRTLVFFTSDNGPRVGSAGPLRGRKATLYEGGYRVPCLVRWPGRVPARAVCSEVAATLDVLPTLARLSGARVPADRVIDGRDITPLLLGEKDARSPHECYVLDHGLGAVRAGRWKFYPWPQSIVRPRKQGVKGFRPGPLVQLYDLSRDLGETTNVAREHPEVVKRLASVYREHVEELRTRSRRKADRP